MRRGYPVVVAEPVVVAVFSAPVVVAERLAVVAVHLPVDGRIAAPTSLQWFAADTKMSISNITSATTSTDLHGGVLKQGTPF